MSDTEAQIADLQFQLTAAKRKTAAAESRAAASSRRNGVGRLICEGLPPLGTQRGSGRSTSSLPGYDKPVVAQASTFTIVDKYLLKDLDHTLGSRIWRRVYPVGSDLGVWGSEIDIQSFVRDVLVDITDLAGLQDIHSLIDTQLDFTEHRRPDVVILRKHGVIIGVCKVKKPSPNGNGANDLNSQRLRVQISNCMLRLMHTHGLKTVFAITTTYNHWRICWLQSACTMAASAKLTSVADAVVENDNEILYESEIFERSNPALVEALVSVLLKMNASVIEPVGSMLAPPNVGNRRKFCLVDGDSFHWCSLPATIEKLTYKFPDQRTKLFYLLQDFYGGADGRVWLSCSPSGCIVVLKMSSISQFTTELKIWKDVWNVKSTRIVSLLSVKALVVPYAFNAAICGGTVKFRRFGEWAAEIPNDRFDSSDVFDVVNEDSLAIYVDNPRVAAEQALRRLANGGYRHTDIWWRHVALLPVCSKGVWTVTPIMLDCTNASRLSPEETENVELVVQESLAHLDEELRDRVADSTCSSNL